MIFLESRLLGIEINEAGREVVLSLRENQGAKFALRLHGVERLLLNELRQQNVVEEMTHWKHGESVEGLREVAFALMTGVAEKESSPQLAAVAIEVVDRVIRGDIEMMEISAIFGAQILVSFVSMTIDGTDLR